MHYVRDMSTGKYNIIMFCTGCKLTCSLCSYSHPAQVCSSSLVFLQHDAVVFFPLLQFWKSSRCCCIDTPVEGPAEESSEPAACPRYLPPMKRLHSTCCDLAPNLTYLYGFNNGGVNNPHQ